MNWTAFRLGWYRRSALLLGCAGCPRWLIHWRCRVPGNWGSILYDVRRAAEEKRE